MSNHLVYPSSLDEETKKMTPRKGQVSADLAVWWKQMSFNIKQTWVLILTQKFISYVTSNKSL